MGRERERGDSGIRSHKWVGRERCPKPARKREKIQNKNCIFIASYLFRVDGEVNRSFSSSFYTRCDGAVSISHIYVYNLDNYSLLENCRMHRLFFTKRPMSMAWFIINGLKHAHDWTRPNWPAFLTIDLPTNHRRLILLSSFFFIHYLSRFVVQQQWLQGAYRLIINLTTDYVDRWRRCSRLEYNPTLGNRFLDRGL